MADRITIAIQWLIKQRNQAGKYETNDDSEALPLMVNGYRRLKRTDVTILRKATRNVCISEIETI